MSFRGSLTCNGEVEVRKRIHTDGGWIGIGLSAGDLYCDGVEVRSRFGRRHCQDDGVGSLKN